MMIPILKFKKNAAMTMAEVLVGAAVGSIVLGALIVGTSALQRAFSANSQMARSDADLVRVADYISKDIRNATSVTPGTGANTGSADSVILTLSTVDYFDRKGTPSNASDDVANNPTLTRSGVTYGASAINVRYLKSGSRIAREVTRTDNGAQSTSVTWIADAVSTLSVKFDTNQIAMISSSSATYFRVPTSGKPLPSTTFVMASQSKNQIP
jgi:type II secretory pathway component PulJ